MLYAWLWGVCVCVIGRLLGGCMGVVSCGGTDMLCSVCIVVSCVLARGVKGVWVWLCEKSSVV